MENNNLTRKQGVYAVHVLDDKDVNYIYIGSGFLDDRLGGNLNKLKRGVHENRQLQEAYNKYKNEYVELLEVCDSIEEARDLENDYIGHFKKIEGFIVCNKRMAVVHKKQYKRTLNESDVIDIQKLIAEGERNKDIAKIYNVDPSTISRIKTGVRWPGVRLDNIEKIMLTS